MKTIIALITLALASLALAQPALVVSPQMMGEDMMMDSVVLSAVALDEDGFVVVHAFDTNGELVLDPPLGVVYLPRGVYADVEVPLDADVLAANGYGAETKNVLPMIHVDANANEIYEFPDGDDVPVMVNDEMVVAELPLMVEMMDEEMMDDDSMDGEMMDDDSMDGEMMDDDAMMDEEMMDDDAMMDEEMMDDDAMMADGDMMMTPMLMVSPQMSSTIMLDSVTLAEDGFVVVHAFDTSGELVLDPPLGLVYLTAGTHEGVMVELDGALLADYAYGAEVKDVLPMIHVDANANQMYEFPDGGDVPVMVNEEMVVATLPLTLQ